MQPFMLMFALFQATLFAVLAFFVLFAASRAQGLLKHFGNVLGIWLIAITLVSTLAFVTAPLFPGKTYTMMAPGYGWMHRVPAPNIVPPAAPDR